MQPGNTDKKVLLELFKLHESSAKPGVCLKAIILGSGGGFQEANAKAETYLISSDRAFDASVHPLCSASEPDTVLQLHT